MTATPAFPLLAALALATGAPAQQKPSYYPPDQPPLFLPAPDLGDRKPWLVRNFGPVGIGINLTRPGMTMEIHNVEPGSPAEATGKLRKGQIIESINGRVLKDIDPRVILGELITEAEAKDGKIVLKLKDEGEVAVQIPVMGGYRKTWPLDCPKSDKIVRNLADLLATHPEPKWGSVLFLLSTGEEKDLNVVRNWMKDLKSVGSLNWHKGYLGPGVCEYYLRTGDASVLPVIKQMTEELRVNMFSGGWSTRDKPAHFTYSTGSGQVHAGGVQCMVFLLMAKLCGVEVDQYMFDQAWSQFYRFAGHGNVAYGNGTPEGGFRDNGKTSGLALALGAAALIDPAGEQSVYAKARDNSAMKAFYATNWFHAAHTGGGLGEIWHHSAISQMREKRPQQYRSYLDTRRWVMDLSRRFDGSIGIAGMDDRYDRSASEDVMAWGTYFALTYTYPRKQLQLFGAPRSKWAKSMSLPRPWGNLADDQFHAIEPIAGGPLTLDELLKEKVETHASSAVFAKFADPNLPDETLFKYLHHPEYDLRSSAMDQVTKRGRVELIVPLLKSDDARLRQAGLLALTGMFKGKPVATDQITPEMYDLVGRMVEEPKESWWVAYHAVQALSRADVKSIEAHRERLIGFLGYNCTWLQTAATCALARLCTMPEHYQTLLPMVLDKSASFRVDEASRLSSKAIQDAMKTASPEVRAFADPLFKKTYASVPGVITEPNTGAVMHIAGNTIRARFGEVLQSFPDGRGFIMKMPKTTLASHISGKSSDQYRYSGTFTPNSQLVGTWAWAVWPAPKKPDEIDKCIQAYIASQKGNLPKKVDKPKDLIVIQDGGQTAKSKFYPGFFWSGNMLVGINDDIAVKMEVRSAGGRDFLIIEDGRFTAVPETDATTEVAKDFHPGLHIYLREID